MSSNSQTDPAISPPTGLQQLVVQAYKKMLLFLFLGALAIICLLLLLIFVLRHAQEPSIFLVVVLAGTMGAFFSALQRLYDFDNLPLTLYDQHFGNARIFLFIYSLVPALVGAIAAAVTYLIFAGHLLSGDFFPAFECKKTTCDSFAALLSDFGPKAPQDYAKAILWGFVAGFAERMVPSLLNSFAQAADKSSVQQLLKSKSDLSSAPDQETVHAGNLSVPTPASRGSANNI